MDSGTATKHAATDTVDKHTGSRQGSRDSEIHEGPDTGHATVVDSRPATSSRATVRDLTVSVADVPDRAVVTGPGRAVDPNADGNSPRPPAPVSSADDPTHGPVFSIGGHPREPDAADGDCAPEAADET
jgi:hypothetical protein